MKKLLYTGVIVLLALQSQAQMLIINEVAYSNKTILFDNDGNTPDWFEIYNPNNYAVNLLDYQVTDDTSKVSFWRFSGYIIQPLEYLIVFASDKDKHDSSGFHTNFRLRNMKESLFILNPNGEIINKIDATCVPTDCSLGRKPDGSTSLSILKPTPGRTNNNAEKVPVNYVPDTLIIDYKSGFYTEPLSVSMSNLHLGNKIMYTLDGSDPDEESAEYNESIYLKDLTPSENRFANIPETIEEPGDLIFKANVLRAIVFSDGCPASNEISNTYFINSNIKDQYKVSVVSLITDKDNLFDDEDGIYVSGDAMNYNQHGKKWERSASIEIFDSTGSQIIDQACGIRIHGRGSRNSPQKSIRLYAGEEYGKESFLYPFFNQKPELNEFKTLLLRSTGGNLGPLFKDELCNHLVQDMDMDYNASETSVLFINGEYWGIYSLMERQDKYYIENNYKVPNPALNIIGYDMKQILVEEGSMDSYNDIIDFIDCINPSSEEFYSKISEKIDIDGLIDFFIAQLYFANIDFPQNNLELWKFDSDTSRWRYFFFDSDASMIWLKYDHLSEYNNTREDRQRFPEYSTFILRSLLQNDEFRYRFLLKYNYHLNTTFNASRVIEEISNYEKKYAPLVPEHIYRWHDPVDYIKWEDNVEWLKVFAMQRPMIMEEQLRNNFGNPFTIYPNPCQNNFNINFLGPVESATIKIYSIKGELLAQWQSPQFTDNSFNIATDLASGLYIVNVMADNISYVSKLIIQ